MDIVEHARSRYAIKGYQAAKPISDDIMVKLKELLQLAPSSLNLQPWHFIWATSEAGKARIAKAAEDAKYIYNKPSILNASAAVVFCSLKEIDDAYLERIANQEATDGRYGSVDDEQVQQSKAKRVEIFKMYCGLHKAVFKDEQHWLNHQSYINLGQFLLGAEALGVGATPMEGFDTAIMDAEFGLAGKGYASQVIVTLGYSDPETDYNGTLSKSRLPMGEILTEV